MHPPEIKRAALDLIAAGHNDCEVSRRLGVPRRTIMDWRRRRYEERRVAYSLEICPRCWRPAKPMVFTPSDYAQLLGVYLGDGYVSRGARTYRLRIYLDSRYPKMNGEIKLLMERCFRANAVTVTKPSRSPLSGRDDTCTVLSIYSTHLPCVFPQHGSGRKHERSIVLEDWQEAAVAAAPWGFIRGCIQTDGCAFVNRTDIQRSEPYEYLSYQFSNRSLEIVELFVGACCDVSVQCRVTGSHERGWAVRINRRSSVALMREHVGVKR